MNTLFKRYGIFNKDFQLLQKMLVSVLIFQAILMALIPPVVMMLREFRFLDIPAMNFEDWFPKMQVALSVLFSLIAAGHWWAEERGGKNDVLLLRLPISRMQLWMEKTFAGLSVIFILLLIQCLWAAVTITLGAKVADHPSEYYWLLIVVTLYAYLIGLPLSYFMKHTIGVIVLGLAALLPTMFVYQFFISLNEARPRRQVSAWETGWDRIYEVTKIIVSVFPFILLVVVPVGIWIFARFRKKRESNFTNQRFWVLIQKQYIEMKYYLLGAIVLLLMNIILALGASVNSFWVMILTMMFLSSVILSLLLGILTYQHDEKGGLNSVLYHHPVSLSEIYWSKILVNLSIASVLSIAILIPAMFIIADNAQHSNQMKNLQTQIVMYQGYSLGAFSTLMLNLFFAGLLPFAVGVLMCHIIPNTIYAFLESVPFGIAAIALYVYLQFADKTFTAEYIAITTGTKEPFFIPIIPWLLMFLLSGLILMGWRAATDRRLLTSTIFQRHLYIARVFCFVLAVTVIVSKVGFWDSLYLITGLDLGIG